MSRIMSLTNTDYPSKYKNYLKVLWNKNYLKTDFWSDATTVVFDYHETGADSNFQYHEEYIPFQTFVKKTPAPRGKNYKMNWFRLIDFNYQIDQNVVGLKLFYNMTESVVTRKTAEFLLHHPVAKEFREWVQDIKVIEYNSV